MNFIEVLLVGRKYMWRRGLSYSKLDRVFFKQPWNDTFPNMILKGVKCSRSDHIRLLVCSANTN